MPNFYQINYSLRYADFEFALEGFQYLTELDIEDDNKKLTHYIKNDLNGNVYQIDYTPYSRLSKDQVMSIIESVWLTEEYDLYTNQQCEFDI